MSNHNPTQPTHHKTDSVEVDIHKDHPEIDLALQKLDDEAAAARQHHTPAPAHHAVSTVPSHVVSHNVSSTSVNHPEHHNVHVDTHGPKIEAKLADLAIEDKTIAQESADRARKEHTDFTSTYDTSSDATPAPADDVGAAGKVANTNDTPADTPEA